MTLIGLDFAALLGGAVITEFIWNWDGLGLLVLSAIGSRDAPLVVVLTMMLAAMFVFVNAFVDILYAFLNPKIRLEDSE